MASPFLFLHAMLGSILRGVCRYPHVQYVCSRSLLLVASGACSAHPGRLLTGSVAGDFGCLSGVFMPVLVAGEGREELGIFPSFFVA